MKKFLKKCWCPKCQIEWYSCVAGEGGVYYCPECGAPMDIQTGKYDFVLKDKAKIEV